MKSLAKACLYSTAVVFIIAALASIESLSGIAYVLLPGAFVAALIFPQGIDSDHGSLYLAFAAAIDVLILALPLGLILAGLKNARRASSKNPK